MQLIYLLLVISYRAQLMEKQKHSPWTYWEDSGVVQDETELSDDVEALLYNAIQGSVGCSWTTGNHSKRSLHFSSTHPTSPS